MRPTSSAVEVALEYAPRDTVAVPIVIAVFMVIPFPRIGSDTDTVQPLVVMAVRARAGISPAPGEEAILPASITDLEVPFSRVKSSLKVAVWSELNVFPMSLIVALVDRSTISTLEKSESRAVPIRLTTQESMTTSPPEAARLIFVNGPRAAPLIAMPEAGVSDAKDTLRLPVEVGPGGGPGGGVTPVQRFAPAVSPEVEPAISEDHMNPKSV